MGFFYRAGGGGATNDPTFPTGDLDVGEDVGLVSFNMANGGSTPAAVEFSFSGSNLLEAVDPDAGTATSPSFVVDPDDTPRTIQFRRGTTDAPSTDTVVTASYSSPSGPVGSFSVTVDPASMSGIVRTVATPTLEFAKGSLTNTGSLGSGYNWVNNGGAGNISSSPRSARSVFGGFHLYDSTGNSLSTPAVSSDAFRRSPTQSRTWLMAYESDDSGGWSDNSAYLSPYGDSSSSTPGGLLFSGSTVDKIYFYKNSSADKTLNTSLSHSDGGASETMRINGTYQKLCMVAVVWDNVAATITVFYKQETHTRSGYSFFTESANTQNIDSSYKIDIIGKGSDGSDGRPLKTFYYGVLDSVLTGAEFQKIIGIAGIG